MKTLKIYTSLIVGLLLFSACDLEEIDNYEGPDATIHGGIYDQLTGELLQQDIINGMQIEYIEHGFDNPQNQYMVVKNDGTYRNDLMFSGTYTIRPVRGNFVPVEEEIIEVEGNTLINFQVQPYIRLQDVVIERQDNKVVATFHLEQTVTNKVSKIGLFAHEEPNVGSPLNSVASITNINAVSNDVTQYRVEINLDANTGSLEPGKQYYFRVGAQIDAPEAKYNYAPAVRLTI